MDWSSISTFLKHGIHHVLTGWDHLLFAAALILAVRGFWEVFKIIGVFTVAHSITVTVTALRGEALFSSQVVEPIIAGSIIVVALENIMRPASAVSARRLFIAFAFGLVHGLGLGGALLENLSGLSGSTIGWAIAAFCIGVEIGHLCVVAPLSGVLKIVNDACGHQAAEHPLPAEAPDASTSNPSAPDSVYAPPQAPLVQRMNAAPVHPGALLWGSIPIAIGGAYYLLAALGVLPSPE